MFLNIFNLSTINKQSAGNDAEIDSNFNTEPIFHTIS